MAVAWIIEPARPIGPVTTIGTPQAGAGAFLFNDYAGVICQLACDAGLNAAAVTFDLGTDTPIDTVMAFGVALVPADASFTVSYATAAQGPFTGGSTASALTPAYAGSVPITGGAGVSLWSADSPVIARYVRLTYYAGAAGQSWRASRIVVGRRIQLERNFSFGAAFGVRDLGSLDWNRRGVLQRARGRKLRTVELTFSHVRRDEVESMTKPLLERSGNSEMVAVVTDPSPDAQRQNRCYFGPLVGDLSHVWAKASGFEAKINVASVF